MRDWSNALVCVSRDSRKAEEAMNLLGSICASPYRDTLKATAEEHLCAMQQAVIDAMIWLRAQP